MVRGRCVICTSSFCTTIAALNCGHTFHYDCILPWVRQSKNCPICREKTTERQIVKQLYFDSGGDEEGSSQNDPMKAEMKVEELTIKLSKTLNDFVEVEQKLIKSNMEVDHLKKRLEREKQRYPIAEQRCRSLEMALEDQEALKQERKDLRAKLNACNFYVKINGGSDEKLRKYITQSGNPNEAEFIALQKRQLDALRKEYQQLSNDFKRYQSKNTEFMRKESEYKRIIQDLRKEADELRISANVSTPYNSKLKPIFDKPLPGRPSLGFDESVVAYDADVINTAFKKQIHKPRFVPSVQVEQDEGPMDEVVNETIFMEEENIHPTTSKASEPLPFTLDDTIDDSLAIPRSIADRIMTGNKPKKPDGLGGSKFKPTIELFEDDFDTWRRPLHNAMNRKRPLDVEKPKPSAPISNFFKKYRSSNDVITLN